MLKNRLIFLLQLNIRCHSSERRHLVVNFIAPKCLKEKKRMVGLADCESCKSAQIQYLQTCIQNVQPQMHKGFVKVQVRLPA